MSAQPRRRRHSGPGRGARGPGPGRTGHRGAERDSGRRRARHPESGARGQERACANTMSTGQQSRRLISTVHTTCVASSVRISCHPAVTTASARRAPREATSHPLRRARNTAAGHVLQSGTSTGRGVQHHRHDPGEPAARTVDSPRNINLLNLDCQCPRPDSNRQPAD